MFYLAWSYLKKKTNYKIYLSQEKKSNYFCLLQEANDPQKLDLSLQFAYTGMWQSTYIVLKKNQRWPEIQKYSEIQCRKNTILSKTE